MFDQNVSFANVEFEIETRENIDGLLECLGENIDISHHGQLENGIDFVSFSLSETYETPEAVIAKLCSMVESLPSHARSNWDECEVRRFDIGFESGNTKLAISTKIKQETIKRVSGIGGSLAITIYPVSPSWQIVRS